MSTNEAYFRVRNGIVSPDLNAASATVSSDILLNGELVTETYLRQDTASSTYLTSSSLLDGGGP